MPILTATDLTTAQNSVAGVVTQLTNAKKGTSTAGGADQAYTEAQAMAAYVFVLPVLSLPAVQVVEMEAAAKAKAQAEARAKAEAEAELPSVGDSSIPMLAQGALVLSLVLMAGGGMVVARRRIRS